MTSGEMVVTDKVSDYGLHQLHVVRAGSPVERENYLSRAEGSEVAAIFEYLEEEIGMWHLRLWWKDGPAEEALAKASSPGGGNEGQ